MKKTILILNGGPGIGKDTLADLIMAHNFRKMEMKSRLIELALIISGINSFEWNLRYNNRKFKELPWDRLGGLSQRQFLIRVSEEWIKPTFGDDYFGLLASDEIDLCLPNNIVFPDGGFLPEVLCIPREDRDVYVARLHRYGFDFSNDSRGYLPDHPDYTAFDVHLVEDRPADAVRDILKNIK